MRVSNVDKHTKEGELPVRLCNYVDVYKNDQITERLSFMRATATAEEIERFRVESGDVLITKDSEIWNDIGIPALVEYTAEDLVCGYHLALLRPAKSLLSGDYLFRAMQSPVVAYQFHVAANGVTRYGLSHDVIKSVFLPIPPFPEQAAIARFLDYMDRRIRRHIRAKQRLIKLLEEQKQAIIHRAVTRGLDPNVRLKASGVEWLGDMPEYWEVTRLKFIAAQIVDCLHATPAYSTTGEYPAIRTADVQPGRLLLESARRVDEEHYLRWTARMAPEEGDILYTREGERFGIAALVPANVRLCISQRMMAFRIHPIHNSAYIMWQINCRHIYEQAAADLIGAAAPHVNVDRIKNFWLVLPPRPEQEMIVAAVTRAHAGPNAAIARAHDEISLLREYRTRLIADVVTGKLDVREAAARLPDEAEELEPFNEAETLSDADEDAADDLAAASEENEL
jgi:type I restriction enzyme S subunit